MKEFLTMHSANGPSATVLLQVTHPLFPDAPLVETADPVLTYVPVTTLPPLKPSDPRPLHDLELTGLIREAVIHEMVETPGRYVTGWLQVDAKERFTDETFVRTSFIVEGPDEAGLIRTRNSVYKLEMKKKMH